MRHRLPSRRTLSTRQAFPLRPGRALITASGALGCGTAYQLTP